MEDRHLPSPEASWRRELRLGLGWLREGEFERAGQHFERAHLDAPDRPEVCYALGRERLRQDRPVEAEALLRAAWVGDPSLVSAAGALARCLALHLGEPDQATAVLDRAGPAPELDVVRAEILLDLGRIGEARGSAERALEADDSATSTTAIAARAALARVHNHDGIDHAERGQHDAALFAFKRAAACDPRWSSPHVNMGAVFCHLGKLARARRAFEDALVIEPDNSTAHLDLGLALRDDGETERARFHLERALELDPELDIARSALADLELLAGDCDSACARLSERVERDPADPQAWSELGAALAAAGDRSGAESCYRQAIDLDPHHAPSCHRLADLLARDGRYIEAALLAERARSREPVSER